MSVANVEQKKNSCAGLPAVDTKAGIASEQDSGQPTVEQRAVGRWGDTPPDILAQLMAWSSRIEDSTASVHALGCVSKRFDAAMKEFQRSDLYLEKSLSGAMHRQTTRWVRSYLSAVGRRPGGAFPDSRASLQAALANAATAATVRSCGHLWIDASLKDAYREDWLGEFRAYGGQSLAVAAFGQGWAWDLIAQMERALPDKVALNVHVNGFEKGIDDARLAGFIAGLCAGGRPMAFEFSSVDFSACPLASKALLDALCGQGFVMCVSVEQISAGSADGLLQDLTDRFDQLAHVQFIGLSRSDQRITYAGIEALQAAIDRRREAKGSRVNVALGFSAWSDPGVRDKPLASDETRRQLEGAGLYFGKAGGTAAHSDIVNRISASTGKGAIDRWRKPVRPQPVEELSDSDSIIGSSSDDEVDELPDDMPASVEHQREAPSRNDAASEPQMKKRDKCVTS